MAKDRFGKEEWRNAPTMVMAGQHIPFGLCYEVSSHGRVRRKPDAAGQGTRRGRVKRLTECGEDRRRKATLSVRGKKFKVDVHALVARAFLGPPPDSRYRVMHIGGDRADNRANRLAWATESEIKQARDLGWNPLAPVIRQVLERRDIAVTKMTDTDCDRDSAS